MNEVGPSAPVLAAPSLHAPAGPTRHLAMFAVRADVIDLAHRRAVAAELRDRLLALADLPEVLDLDVWLADEGNADVAFAATYHRSTDLDRLRAEPRHRAMVAWYVEHFDDALRRDLSFVIGDRSDPP